MPDVSVGASRLPIGPGKRGLSSRYRCPMALPLVRLGVPEAGPAPIFCDAAAAPAAGPSFKPPSTPVPGCRGPGERPCKSPGRSVVPPLPVMPSGTRAVLPPTSRDSLMLPGTGRPASARWLACQVPPGWPWPRCRLHGRSRPRPRQASRARPRRIGNQDAQRVCHLVSSTAASSSLVNRSRSSSPE